MGFISTWNEDRGPRWLAFMHPVSDRKAEETSRLLYLYGVRALALVAGTCLWVAMTLSTGIFSVAMVIPIGVAIGVAHLALTRALRRPHLPSALAVTLLGGLLANVLAGLALFSNHYGVSYWQVLTARQFPDDLSMLCALFFESFRFQDAAFYLMSMVAVFFLAQIKSIGKVATKEKGRG